MTQVSGHEIAHVTPCLDRYPLLWAPLFIALPTTYRVVLLGLSEDGRQLVVFDARRSVLVGQVPAWELKVVRHGLVMSKLAILGETYWALRPERRSLRRLEAAVRRGNM
jgi:hypothetical protein